MKFTYLKEIEDLLEEVETLIEKTKEEIKNLEFECAEYFDAHSKLNFLELERIEFKEKRKREIHQLMDEDIYGERWLHNEHSIKMIEE